MTKNREDYYTLLLYDNESDVWFDEFGSYDYDEVSDEAKGASEVYDWISIVKTDGSIKQLLEVTGRLNVAGPS